MATLELGSIVSDIRGSVGGETYSRNPAGLYVKSRSSPAQPVSARRTNVQTAFTTLTQAWSGTLTEAQRKTWREYAKVWPVSNRLGKRIHLSGACHFVRCNFYKTFLTAGIGFLVAPPGGPIAIPQFEFTATASTNKISVSFPLLNYADPPQWMFVLCYAGKVVNAGQNYYSTPWRYIDYTYFDGAVWHDDPWLMTPPWTLVQGKKIFVKMAAYYNSGESSGPFQCSGIIV